MSFSDGHDTRNVGTLAALHTTVLVDFHWLREPPMPQKPLPDFTFFNYQATEPENRQRH